MPVMRGLYRIRYVRFCLRPEEAMSVIDEVLAANEIYSAFSVKSMTPEHAFVLPRPNRWEIVQASSGPKSNVTLSRYVA